MLSSKRTDAARREALKVARAESRPTPELKARQEHITPPQIDRTTFRESWKVETRLDGLAKIGAIRLSAYLTAQAFADDFHSAHGGGGMDLAGAGGGSSTNFDPSYRQVSAMGRVRRATDRIGHTPAFLLIQCACLDAPWSHTAKLLTVTVDLVKAATIEAITLLDEPSVKGPAR